MNIKDLSTPTHLIPAIEMVRSFVALHQELVAAGFSTEAATLAPIVPLATALVTDLVAELNQP